MAKSSGILNRLFQRKVESRNSTSVLFNNSQWFLDSFGLLTSSGESVNSKAALAINAVYISAKIIGESIATLSFNTYRRDGQSRMQEDTPARRLLTVSPDPELGVTASDFWKAVGVQVATHGNAYAQIDRDGNTPYRIRLWQPWQVHIKEVEDGIMYVNDVHGSFEPDDVLHFKNNSWDGIMGLNPIREQREIIGLAQKQLKYAGAQYGNKPNGYIHTDERLSPEQQKQVAEFWKAQANANGVSGEGTTPVLTAGMKFAHIPLSPVDIDYINTASLTEDQIFNLYRIPPPMRGDYERATFANAEQAELVFMKHCIMPYVVSFEQEINLKLFPISNRTTARPLFAKFNMNSTMRADFKSRTDGYATLFQNGVMSANEIRGLEDMNPRPDGDYYYVPLNMVREDMQREVLLKDKQNGQG